MKKTSTEVAVAPVPMYEASNEKWKHTFKWPHKWDEALYIDGDNFVEKIYAYLFKLRAKHPAIHTSNSTNGDGILCQFSLLY